MNKKFTQLNNRKTNLMGKSRFVIRSLNSCIFVLLLAAGVLGFGESVEAACDYCSEANCADYLICEDWDSGTPPTDPWPTVYGPTWHDWKPADYGTPKDGDITENLSHSGQRSLILLKGAGDKSTVDLEHLIPGNPPIVYVRLYLYLQSEEIENFGEYCHFIFLNTASYAETCLDFRPYSQDFCKPTDSHPENCCPYNEGYSDPDRPCWGEGGIHHYEWAGHVMLAPRSYNPDVYVVETEGVPFFWEEHTDEWVLVEWKVDFANDKTSLWINETLYIDNYDMDFAPSSATAVILSGYGQISSGNTHYHIDDVVVSTSYIGPKDGAPDTTPPPRSNPQPTGTLTSGTTSTTISLDTNETAECKYDTVSGVTFDQQQFTFDTPVEQEGSTGQATHSATVSNLEDGNSYTYYIRCQDESGNANTDDFEILFSIASSTTYSISNFINLVTDWLKTESGLESDVNGDGVVNTRDLGIMMSNWGE